MALPCEVSEAIGNGTVEKNETIDFEERSVKKKHFFGVPGASVRAPRLFILSTLESRYSVEIRKIKIAEIDNLAIGRKKKETHRDSRSRPRIDT